jgi:hypothetical protein
VGESVRGFKFCGVLDGLLCERARLTAIKVASNCGGVIYWLHRVLATRALSHNLKLTDALYVRGAFGSALSFL